MHLLVDGYFEDLDQLVEAVRFWDIDFRLMEARGFSARVKQVLCDDLMIGYAGFGINLNQAGAIPPGFQTFAIPGRNCTDFWWRGRRISRDHLLIFPFGSELRGASQCGFEVFVISVRESLLEQLCHELHLAPSRFLNPGSRDVVPLPRPEMASLRNAAEMALFCSQSSAQSATALLSLARQLTAAVEDRSKRSPVSRRRRDEAVDRVIDHLTCNGPQQLDLASLCRISGVSERSLQYAFKERYDISPATFVKRWKLNSAHRLLLADGSVSSVGDVATRLGFWHPSQFANDYHRLFGELPSQTLRRRS